MTESIDWTLVSNFKPNEFPENPDLYAEPNLIYTLQDLRSISAGNRIYPSPVNGALARFDGSKTSQHYVGPKDNPVRKSTAIDFFMEGIPIENMTMITSHPKIGGIGVYLDGIGVDGKHWVRFHIDIRDKGFINYVPTFWIVEKKFDNYQKKSVDKYYYPQNTKQHWELLKKDVLYRDRIKR